MTTNKKFGEMIYLSACINNQKHTFIKCMWFSSFSQKFSSCMEVKCCCSSMTLHFFTLLWSQIAFVCQWLILKIAKFSKIFRVYLSRYHQLLDCLSSLYKETTSLYPTARKFEAYLFGLGFVCRDVMTSEWQDARIVFSI